MTPATPPTPAPVPRFVELGSDRCQSCKAMIPVLAELRAAHAGALQVDFIDVWDHPDEAERYKVTIIPTQVFFAPDGKEIFRHQGFFPADAIRARFAALGFPLPVPGEG
ncbi:MAG: thioredoxin [Deltaproteobacteria bacterium]|nr:MAG: thioredoxin [Deltaproteobacteria bacterium]